MGGAVAAEGLMDIIGGPETGLFVGIPGLGWTVGMLFIVGLGCMVGTAGAGAMVVIFL